MNAQAWNQCWIGLDESWNITNARSAKVWYRKWEAKEAMLIESRSVSCDDHKCNAQQRGGVRRPNRGGWQNLNLLLILHLHIGFANNNSLFLLSFF